MPNDPSSATRRTGRNDCNRDALAGFAAAHGLAHLTFTQRSIHAVLPIKADIPGFGKPVHGKQQSLGELLVACRKKAGLKQRELALASGIPRKWLGRWERNRALPGQEGLSRLAQVLKLPDLINLLANTPS